MSYLRVHPPFACFVGALLTYRRAVRTGLADRRLLTSANPTVPDEAHSAHMPPKGCGKPREPSTPKRLKALRKLEADGLIRIIIDNGSDVHALWIGWFVFN